MAWYEPTDISEALQIMDAQHPILISGGTDMFVNWPRRQTDYEDRDFLSLGQIEALQSAWFDEDSRDLVIGAAVTAQRIWSSSACSQVAALQEAARVVGGWQIQNRATIGGN